jgi:hypothetical protein
LLLGREFLVGFVLEVTEGTREIEVAIYATELDLAAGFENSIGLGRVLGFMVFA